MEFSNWKLRKQIMASGAPDCIKFGMLVIADNIDWNTGYKKFTSKTHYHNWLKRVADQYPLKEAVVGPKDTIESWEGYRLIIEVMKEIGFASMVDGQFQLVLQEDDWDEGLPEGAAS